MTDVRHSALTWRLFDLGFAAFRARRMMPTLVGGAWPRLTPGRPIVLVANHISWWDGFLLREVQRQLRADAPFHTVVVAEQMARHPGLRRLGGVPVDPAAPSSVLRMLRTLGRLRLAESETVFAYFPQGRIWPSSRRPLGMRRGIEAVARILAPVDVVPVSIHIEPLVDARPTPFLWLGDPISAGDPDSHVASDEVEARLIEGLDRIRDRLDRWGEDARELWPDATPAVASTTETPPAARPGAAPTLIEPSCAS